MVVSKENYLAVPEKRKRVEKMAERFYAHSANTEGIKHPLADHLSEVSERAKIFCGDVPWIDEAVLAGQLHDIGKYADLFQARLRGEVSGLDHWSLGAWIALKQQAVAAALAIQGHHVGLQQGNNDALRALNPETLDNHHPLNLRLSDTNENLLNNRFSEDHLKYSKPSNPIIDIKKGFQNPIAAMLNVRMLFSCLTDADFLDTEAHFKADKEGKKCRNPGPELKAKESLDALEQFMDSKIRGINKADKTVLNARNALWKMATFSASAKSGLFTFTAPTGSGKTLAMLKFALEHASHNTHIKRIILAVPYLSIIEQTAAIYRAVFQLFPEHYVLEHHSLAGLGSEEANGDAEFAAERARRLLSENWDAPIIITTNVQLLESLFSNRPSACRKLHNLMESVIMFDEAQTLPQSLTVPTLAALSHLSKTYRTTVIFATATQPAFDTLNQAVQSYVPSGWQPTETVPDYPRLYKMLRRYNTHWPSKDKVTEWSKLAEELRNEKQVLCVVNLKSHAATLLDEMKDDEAIIHLSTNLCAYHRQAVLDDVRNKLKQGRPCRLISTQCVEAGVDIDFPVVYRAIAPLDSIAQAAGRCNREGKLTDKSGKRIFGEVRVFEPDIEGDYRRRYPTRAYFQAAEVTRTMLTLSGKDGIDLNDPTVFRDYYHRLYDLSKPETQSEALIEAMTVVDFACVSKEYRLIDQSAIQVLVPYEKKLDKFFDLRKRQDEQGINAQWMRQAQGLTVSVFRPKQGHAAWEVLIPAKLRYGKESSDEWYILEDPDRKFYDEILGLRLPQSQQIMIA
jgi:CRISPR-associated helicase Cas3/CRISPR-associated endonuclease Cas3-HD